MGRQSTIACAVCAFAVSMCILLLLIVRSHVGQRSPTTLPVPSQAGPAVERIDCELVIFALSSRTNFGHRNATRQTWAANIPPGVLLRFVVGKPCLIARDQRSRPALDCEPINPNKPDDPALIREEELLQEQLVEENRHFNDMLLLEVLDVYIALPNKLIHALSWGYESTSAKFFMKTDDDVYMDLARILTLKLGDPSQIGFVGGSFGPGLQPDRDPKGKWYQSPSGPRGWIFSNYAEFPHGQCYFVTRGLAALLSRVKDDVRVLQGEDVSMGMWNYMFRGNVTSIPQLLPGCDGWVQHLWSSTGHYQHHTNFLKCGRPCGC